MTEIAKFILNNFNKSTFDRFDALFAVQSVPMLIRYYKIFQGTESQDSLNIGITVLLMQPMEVKMMI